jgi:mono/diheme cytochrome c family protein
MKRLVCCLLFMYGSALHLCAEGPGALFNRRCRACHTFGGGDLVGPDLKGITERHSRAWLMAWISSSQILIRSGDPTATALFTKFRQIPMPDQSFEAGDLESLLNYFADGGPEAEAKRTRRAESATPAEIGLGRALFLGQLALRDGGASCVSCHRIGDTALGGTLGPELTHAYSKFQDRRLAALLARGCFPRVPDISARKSLSDDEAFALKAFLRDTDTNLRVAEHPPSDPRN